MNGEIARARERERERGRERKREREKERAVWLEKIRRFRETEGKRKVN